MSLTIIEKNEAETVGLAEADDYFDGWPSVAVKPEYLKEFAQRCIDMGFENAVVYFNEDQPLFAHEVDDDFGVYVMLAPMKRVCEVCDEKKPELTKYEFDSDTIWMCDDCAEGVGDVGE